MRIKFFALFAIAMLAQASGLQAQEADTTKVSSEAPTPQQTIVIVGEKSPFAAGALSALVFPGVGSLYAGNTSRGMS